VSRIFLLSPAHCGGERATLVLNAPLLPHQPKANWRESWPLKAGFHCLSRLRLTARLSSLVLR
jgi:hypothetical protein